MHAGAQDFLGFRHLRVDQLREGEIGLHAETSTHSDNRAWTASVAPSIRCSASQISAGR